MSFNCSSALDAPGSALEEKRQNKYGLWQGLIAYCHIRTVTLQAGKLVHSWSVSSFGLATYQRYGISRVYKALEFSNFLLRAVFLDYFARI